MGSCNSSERAGPEEGEAPSSVGEVDGGRRPDDAVENDAVHEGALLGVAR